MKSRADMSASEVRVRQYPSRGWEPAQTLQGTYDSTVLYTRWGSRPPTYAKYLRTCNARSGRTDPKKYAWVSFATHFQIQTPPSVYQLGRRVLSQVFSIPKNLPPVWKVCNGLLLHVSELLPISYRYLPWFSTYSWNEGNKKTFHLGYKKWLVLHQLSNQQLKQTGTTHTQIQCD